MQAEAAPVHLPGIGDLPNWLRDEKEYEAIKHFVTAEAAKIDVPVTYHDFLALAADALFDIELTGPSFTKLKRWVLAGRAERKFGKANYQLRLRLLVSLLMRLQMHAYFPGQVRGVVTSISTEALEVVDADRAHELVLPLSSTINLMDESDGSQSVEAWLKTELAYDRKHKRA